MSDQHLLNQFRVIEQIGRKWSEPEADDITVGASTLAEKAQWISVDLQKVAD